MTKLMKILTSLALLASVAACSQPSENSMVFKNYNYAPATYSGADQGVFHMNYSR